MRYEKFFLSLWTFLFWLKNFLRTPKNSIEMENNSDKKCCVNFLFSLVSSMKLSSFSQNERKVQQSSQVSHEKLKISFDDILWFSPHSIPLLMNFSESETVFCERNQSPQRKGKNLYHIRLVLIQTLIDSVEEKNFSVENFKKETSWWKKKKCNNLISQIYGKSFATRCDSWKQANNTIGII